MVSSDVVHHLMENVKRKCGHFDSEAKGNKIKGPKSWLTCLISFSESFKKIGLRWIIFSDKRMVISHEITNNKAIFFPIEPNYKTLQSKHNLVLNLPVLIMLESDWSAQRMLFPPIQSTLFFFPMHHFRTMQCFLLINFKGRGFPDCLE